MPLPLNHRQVIQLLYKKHNAFVMIRLIQQPYFQEFHIDIF